LKEYVSKGPFSFAQTTIHDFYRINYLKSSLTLEYVSKTTKMEYTRNVIEKIIQYFKSSFDWLPYISLLFALIYIPVAYISISRIETVQSPAFGICLV